MGAVEVITRSREEDTGKAGESSQEGPNRLLAAMPETPVRTTEPRPSLQPAQPAARFLELRGVTRRYGRLVALQDVNLSVQPGEFVVVTGPSEAGKTTLLKLIHGDLRPSKGFIRVDGFRLERRWRRFLPRLRRRVAAVSQDHRLLHDMSVRGNVAFALRVSDLWLPGHEVRARAQARLDEVGLGKRPGAYPHQLSGGQQRRLAIARALVTGPVLLLADEPTSNLDRTNAERVVDLLERCCQAGTTVLMATHDVELVRSRGHRVVELRAGRIVADLPATAPMSSNGAAARLIADRHRRDLGLRAPIGRLMQFALGYVPPPPAPLRPERTPLGLKARAARIAQVALGYRPAPAAALPNGAWKPPAKVVERLATNGHGNGPTVPRPAAARQAARAEEAGAWRPPAAVAALTAGQQAPARGADGRPDADVGGKGDGAGAANGSGRGLWQLHLLAQVAQFALGYAPPPVTHPTKPRASRRSPGKPDLAAPSGRTGAAGRLRRPWVPVFNLGRLCVGGAVASWARNVGTVAPALGSIALLLAVAGGLAVGGFALRTLLVTQSREAAVLHVYLSEDAAGDEVDQAHQALAALPHVRSVHYIDKDQALQLARKRPGLGDLASASDSNPFPASLEVQVDQPSDVAAVARVAANEPGVDTRRPTSYDAGTYDRLRQFTVVAAAIAGGFGLLMLAITYAISSNSIRTAVLARRDELLTMQLVGASRWLIRARLGVEGALTGGVAGLIAAAAVVVVCAVCYYAARHLFVQLLPGVTATTVAGVVVITAAAGISLGSVSALFAFRRLRT